MHEVLYHQILKNLPEISDDKIKPYLEKTRIATNKLQNDFHNQKLPCLEIAAKTQDLTQINDLATHIKQKFKNTVILGVGGSSLGAKTLTSIIPQNNHEIIYMESIDGQTLAQNLTKIELENSCFLIISKSGQTIETICQTLILLEEIKKHKIKNFADNLIFVTANKNSTIGQIAQKIGSKIYHHPEDIGGRFSYLTIVGLLPAAISGLNITKIRQGAKKTLKKLLETTKIENNKTTLATLHQLYLFDNGQRNNVIMPYIDSLKNLTYWYRQLSAESLGKSGLGFTPITSMGTVDQHSQLQLYLAGAKDKFYSFITGKNCSNNFDIKDLADIKTPFSNKNLQEIVTIEQNSTIEMLNRQNLPIRIFEFDEINEENLSALMMQFFLETILLANAWSIDAFDQPEVEIRKKLAFEYLEK